MFDTLLRVIIIERLSKAIVYTSRLAGHDHWCSGSGAIQK